MSGIYITGTQRTGKVYFWLGLNLLSSFTSFDANNNGTKFLASYGTTLAEIASEIVAVGPFRQRGRCNTALTAWLPESHFSSWADALWYGYDVTFLDASEIRVTNSLCLT